MATGTTDTFTIRVHNFQSLADAEIVLEDGVTVITGATNNGKSAIVRAVESAVFNTGIDEYIKAGADSLSVELDNGEHRLSYTRKTKGKTDKTTYQFDDGELQQKVGRNQLPEVAKLFNIREVRLQNNQRARLNFWYQNDKPFLMDKTAGQLYEFLSVSSSEKYLSVLKTMLADMKQQESDIKTLSASIDVLKKEMSVKQDILDANLGFPALYDMLLFLKETETKLDIAESLMAAMGEEQRLLDTLHESLRRVVVHIERVPMEHVLAVMGRFIAASANAESLEKLSSDVKRSMERLAVSKKRLEKASVFSDISTGRIASVEKRLGALSSLQKKTECLTTLEEAVSQSDSLLKDCRKRLAKLPVPGCTTEQQATLQENIVSLEKKRQWLLDRRKETTEVMAAAATMKASQDALVSLLARLETSDRELDTLKREMGVCPFCGAVFGNGNNSCSHLFQ